MTLGARNAPLRAHHPQGSDSLLRDLWATTGCCRLFSFLLAYVTGLTLMAPHVPTLVSNYFASQRAGLELHCEQYERGTAPVECHDAHADVVLWASWSSFASNALVSVLVLPILGHWSDLHGRRPYFLIALSAGSLPLLVVLGNLEAGFPLQWYYLVQVFTSSVSVITPCLAYLADQLAPRHRASAFGLIMASFSLAVIIGPTLGALLSPTQATLGALGTLCACFAFVALAIPESLTPEAKEEARLKAEEARAVRAGMGASMHSALHGARGALAILMRSSLFKKLTVCMMLSGMVSEGIQDLLLQYLQLKLNFGVKDQATIFIVFGSCGLLVQTFLLRTLLGWGGEQRVLCLALGANLGQMLALALATAKWQALGAIALGSLGAMSFPTISSIKSSNAQEHEQGSVQGALYGARALASGFGPLVFAWLFKSFTSSHSELPYFPGAPFILAAALMIAALAVAATIPAGAGGSAGSQRHASWRRLNTFKSIPVDVSGGMSEGEGGGGGWEGGGGLRAGLLGEDRGEGEEEGEGGSQHRKPALSSRDEVIDEATEGAGGGREQVASGGWGGEESEPLVATQARGG